MIKNSTRVAALATAAVLALGLGAPSSFAAPHAHPVHATAHGKTAHGKTAAQARRADRAATQVARQAARKERALLLFTRDARFHGIAGDQKTTVQGNAQADHDALAALADDAAAATTVADVQAVAAQVRAYRPVGYVVVENRLRHAAQLQAGADALTATDPTTATQAGTLVQSAVDKALAYHSSDAWSTLREIQQDLNGAAALLPDTTTTNTTGGTGTAS